MGIEIERKFLVTGRDWKRAADPVRFCQGYLCSGRGRVVRVRTAGPRGQLTVKGPGAGQVRSEFEYDIPVADARQMLDQLCDKPLIVKDRFQVVHGGLIWVIDEFLAENEGLVVAEVELDHPDQEIDLPEWIDREVTGDPRYFNAALARHPYTVWK